jgi:hypothetical protein
MGGILYRAWTVFLSERIDAKHAAHPAVLPKSATGAWSCGRDVNRLLPKPPFAFWTPNWHHGRGSDAALSCKCLKCFGGPGEIRTHDLFHAM